MVENKRKADAPVVRVARRQPAVPPVRVLKPVQRAQAPLVLQARRMPHLLRLRRPPLPLAEEGEVVVVVARPRHPPGSFRRRNSDAGQLRRSGRG